MRSNVAPYFAFAAYGLFWGTWGASLPALKTAAGVDDSQLGIALLFVGLGALPAMILTGRAVDRLGGRIAGCWYVYLLHRVRQERAGRYNVVNASGLGKVLKN